MAARTLDDVALQPAVLAHYERVGGFMEASFGGEPIVFANFPAGFDQPPHFTITDVPLQASKLLWLVHRRFALEYHGWAPLAGDEFRLRFARILLECGPSMVFEQTRTAALRMRELLQEEHVDAVPLLDGRKGVALWIPLADAPRAEAVRAWLHQVCNRAVERYPELMTTEPNTVDGNRVHLHVSSNARHRYSALPYSLRGGVNLQVCTPVTWDELKTAEPYAFVAATFEQRIRDAGDVFAREVERIGTQRMPVAAPASSRATLMALDYAPRGHVILAAIAILEDGKTRNAEEILHEALERKAIPPRTTRKYVYTALIEYIARQLGRGHRPQIVQDARRNFRINEPPDDWPDLVPYEAPAVDAQTDALIARLEKTSRGPGSEAFEIACCDAFAHLGFRTQRLGKYAEPDGMADAELGPLGYRVLIECKTGKHDVTDPDVPEAAKFMEAFHGDVATLIGPDFADETELIAELQLHKVAAVTVADLSALLSLGATPLEVRQVLQPGFVSERIGDLTWERRHGKAKQIATVSALVQREGWAAQCAHAARDGRAADAPRLTVDAAMMLVDEALRLAGSKASCTREQVTAAFTHLTDPLVGSAV